MSDLIFATSFKNKIVSFILNIICATYIKSAECDTALSYVFMIFIYLLSCNVGD